MIMKLLVTKISILRSSDSSLYRISDCPVDSTSVQPFAKEASRSSLISINPSESSSASSHFSHQMGSNFGIEKECIHLYFANLHLIYHFLDKAAFLVRCADEIWSGEHQSPGLRNCRKSKFPALYNAIVSVGAITAGDDTVLAQGKDEIQEHMEGKSNKLNRSSGKRKPLYPPLELAQVYFTKAKSLLGDLFEASSLESTQTLFLMVCNPSNWSN